MTFFHHLTRLRAAMIVAAGLGIATPGFAVRAGGTALPSASAVQSSPQQAAKAQADESASLRQGTVTALDEPGARLQVQGVWLDIVSGKTQVLRGGRPVGIGTLKAGDVIRFTVAPGIVEALSLRLVYAP